MIQLTTAKWLCLHVSLHPQHSHVDLVHAPGLLSPSHFSDWMCRSRTLYKQLVPQYVRIVMTCCLNHLDLSQFCCLRLSFAFVIPVSKAYECICVCMYLFRIYVCTFWTEVKCLRKKLRTHLFFRDDFFWCHLFSPAIFYFIVQHFDAISAGITGRLVFACTRHTVDFVSHKILVCSHFCGHFCVLTLWHKSHIWTYHGVNLYFMVSVCTCRCYLTYLVFPLFWRGGRMCLCVCVYTHTHAPPCEILGYEPRCRNGTRCIWKLRVHICVT